MTDDQFPQPRPSRAEDPHGVESEALRALREPAGGFDDSPSFAAEEAAEADHSAWMRPAVGEPERTSEVIGALTPPEPELIPAQEPVDLQAEMPPLTPAEAQASPRRAFDPQQLAGVIGARAALARTDTPGATLDHEPEQFEDGTFAAPPAPPLDWKKLLPWIAGALALALVVFGVVWSSTRKPVVVITPSASPSVTTPPVVTDQHLMTAKDAEAIAPKQGWQVASTINKLTPTSVPISCQNSTQGQPNATAVRQRALTTKSTKGLALLHQVDGFATAADARNAYAARAARLATCDDLPTWIARADKVTGFGDEATAVTIAYQGFGQEQLVTQYHTILLSRTGTAVHAYDVSQSNQPFMVRDLLKGAKLALNRQCATSGGECAQKPSTLAIIPLPTGTPGWLIPSDLQRVSMGAGLWTSTDTTGVTTKGSQCENMTLAAAPGPTTREQRTFLMTQDSTAPQTFGIDEVVLTFKDAKAAKSFSEGLQKNLTSCPSRAATAKVGEAAKIAGKANGTNFEGSTLLVQQSMGGTETARFRVGVVAIDKQVVYLLNNPSASYDLGREKFGATLIRAAERATQK